VKGVKNTGFNYAFRSIFELATPAHQNINFRISGCRVGTEVIKLK
jgi:hypothetical protein